VGGAAHERVRGLEARAEELTAMAAARDRELDLVAFELEEIEAVAPNEDEERELLAERERLRHREALRQAAAGGVAAVSPDEGDGAGALLARAAAELDAAAAFDPALAPLAERLGGLRYEAEDVAAELRSYLGEVEETGSGRSLEEVEERLAVIVRLTRKHGGTVAEVLAHAERCRSRQAELLESEVALEEVGGELAAARAERDRVGEALSAARLEAAPRLAASVRERLGELAMGDARFEVVLRPRDGGFGRRGRDAVEFLIAPNPGLPAGPLREVASGGELSRVMLALLSVAHGGSGDAPGDGSLLVFDEIDAGIGGQTARAVGEHLRALAGGRQILCITHLPQVAALGSRHFTIVKDGSVSPARTTVTALDGDAVVGELVRMLGADDGDRAARGHARELLKAA
jgi:DNA repair protein RecN (Recombination protein N)